MNRQILCSWLGLPEQNWPPDHFALLGLDPTAADAAHIETKVHERMAKLRCYQLSHPEEATEGMNRLAQAYICVTEELAKKTRPPMQTSPANGPALAVPPAPPQPRTDEDTEIGQGTMVDWRVSSPPIRTGPDSLPEVEMNGAPTAAATDAAEALPATPPAPMAPPAVPPDPIHEFAYHSLEARRGLGTLLKVIDRIDRTRQLLVAWKKAGCYLGKPRRKLTKPAEEKDLERRLHRIFEQIQDYPGFVAQPGHPGYRVVGMARLEMTAVMFKSLDDDQRLHLAKDWQAGHAVLIAHRRFLRDRFKTMRREGLLKRAVRFLRATVNDHPIRSAALVILAVTTSVISYLYWLR